jgi:hypothetical protein
MELEEHRDPIQSSMPESVCATRRLAGLGKHVTLDACRHGGTTELGNAELAEQGVMALSGHKTPQAARLMLSGPNSSGYRLLRSGEHGLARAVQPIDLIGTASPARTGDPQIHKPDKGK